MVHYYERNIVEIKNEYTIFLINLITPMIYEGMKSMYNFSVDSYEKLIKTANDPKSVSPPLKIFQTCLKEVPTFNTQIIHKETQRIKEFSRCSEWFDDLVKAAIKSNIVLLTFSTKKQQSNIVNNKYHERISTEDFIHKCYIETARSIYNNPELFWDKYSPIEIKKNQRQICKIIKEAVKESIRKMLPIKLILGEYLKNDYPTGSEEELDANFLDKHERYLNIKKLVDRDLNEEIDDTDNTDNTYNTDESKNELDQEKNLYDNCQDDYNLVNLNNLNNPNENKNGKQNIADKKLNSPIRNIIDQTKGNIDEQNKGNTGEQNKFKSDIIKKTSSSENSLPSQNPNYNEKDNSFRELGYSDDETEFSVSQSYYSNYGSKLIDDDEAHSLSFNNKTESEKIDREILAIKKNVNTQQMLSNFGKYNDQSLKTTQSNNKDMKEFFAHYLR